VIAGVSVEVYSVNWATALQQEIPPGTLSRVSSYDALGNYALTPAGTVIAGPLAAAFGTRAVLAGGGILVVVLPLLVLLGPGVRRVRRRDGGDQPSPAKPAVTGGVRRTREQAPGPVREEEGV